MASVFATTLIDGLFNTPWRFSACRRQALLAGGAISTVLLMLSVHWTTGAAPNKVFLSTSFVGVVGHASNQPNTGHHASGDVHTVIFSGHEAGKAPVTQTAPAAYSNADSPKDGSIAVQSSASSSHQWPLNGASIASFFAWYRAQMEAMPLSMELFHGAAAFAFGDLLAQSLERFRDEGKPGRRRGQTPNFMHAFHGKRIAIAAVVGGTLHAYVLPFWYRSLEETFAHPTMSCILLKAFLSCVFVTPTVIAGSMLHEVEDKVLLGVFWKHSCTEYLRSMDNSWIGLVFVWSIYHVICHLWIPMNLRALCTVAAGSVWTVPSMTCSSVVAKAYPFGSMCSTVSTGGTSPEFVRARFDSASMDVAIVDGSDALAGLAAKSSSLHAAAFSNVVDVAQHNDTPEAAPSDACTLIRDAFGDLLSESEALRPAIKERMSAAEPLEAFQTDLICRTRYIRSRIGHCSETEDAYATDELEASPCSANEETVAEADSGIVDDSGLFQDAFGQDPANQNPLLPTVFERQSASEPVKAFQTDFLCRTRYLRGREMRKSQNAILDWINSTAPAGATPLKADDVLDLRFPFAAFAGEDDGSFEDAGEADGVAEAS